MRGTTWRRGLASLAPYDSEATMIRINNVLCPVDFSEIVMGVHGRRAVDVLLFGSTAHHVIRASACPVLIVRGTEAPFEAEVS